MNDWHTASESQQQLIQEIIGEVRSGTNLKMPRSCPICQSLPASLHMFFCRYEPSGRGGGWLWCSQCHVYEHWSGTVPSWWQNIPGIGIKDLSSQPIFLEQYVHLIDSHWSIVGAASNRA